jgi:hypothetical protein
MQNSKKDPHQQTEAKKGDHSADKSHDQSQDDMQRKDKKNNDQQNKAQHQDASKADQQNKAQHQDASKDKDHAMKNTTSEDTSGAKNAQHGQQGKGKNEEPTSHRGGSGQRSDDN